MSDMSDMSEYAAFDLKLKALNDRLKLARLGVQIERRGHQLSLRGTFPPRPGSDRLRPYQQRLPLDLPATPTGLKTAEQQAKVVAAQLIQQSFDWQEYLYITAGKRLSQLDWVAQMAAFERQFFAHPDRLSNPAASKTTWTSAYAPYLRKLTTIAQAHPRLSLTEVMHKTVQSFPVQSRSRQVSCTALSALAEFLNLPTKDLKLLGGTYGTSKTQARELPSDEAIVQVWQSIPNPAWQAVYGVMATFGLRNHEVFFCDYGNLRQGENRIEVLPTTKTGSHEAWAFYPEWIERFHLRDFQLPTVNTDLSQTTLQRVGQRVTAQFRRYGIPFSPYDLRHAWAVRTIHFGLPDTIAAKMMGHSVAVHTRTYHQWMTRRDQQQAVDAAIARRSVRT
jgi:integrase